MNVNYLNDSDLDFLQHCSEEQLANFARLLTHNEKGKTRLSSVLMRNELFKSMEGASRATSPQLAADCRRITAFWWR
ncbi:putative oxidoreductase [Escherichia coli]|nr:putative oxidoreductase [Escherichia coli]